MDYHISFSPPNQKLFHITLQIKAEDNLILSSAAWRPGRYELQNYPANIFKFGATDDEGNVLPWKKIGTHQWSVLGPYAKNIIVQYSFYANQYNAGGSVLDEDFIYINFINCLLYPAHRMDEVFSIHLDYPSEFILAGDVTEVMPHKIFFNTIHEAFDSPIIASRTIKCLEYTVDQTLFQVWFNKSKPLDYNFLSEPFVKFTQAVKNIFGSFPFERYEFLFLISAFPYYHGVEHANSTVIVLGPEADFEKEKFKKDLLGIACHELFHAWNICRIRPQELLPYNFSKSTVFETGYIAEGVTTYYGDVLLLRSKVYDEKTYWEEFETMLERHFRNFGRFNSSLADSSLDLWVDGYVPGIPNKKTSIYNEGALAAFILDILIRKHTHNQKSLDHVMQRMWQEFGSMKKGYTTADYKKIAEEVADVDLTDYFDTYIYGTTGFEEGLKQSLNYLGMDLKKKDSPHYHSCNYGFTTQWKDGFHIVHIIEPNAPADMRLAVGDKILEINGMIPDQNLDVPLFATETIFLQIERMGVQKMISLSATLKTFLHEYHVVVKKNHSLQETQNYIQWAGL